ncbi:MAG: DUF5996 family protein [Anaerolineae bacterium]
MPLPPLTEWTATAHGLHRAAQILAGIRLLLLPHVPNYLELALSPVPEGLSTGRLPSGGEIVLDMRRCALIYHHDEEPETAIPLAATTQAYANRALLNALSRGELAGTLAYVDDDGLLQAFTDALKAKRPDLPPDHLSFMETDPLNIDPVIARDYAAVLDAAFTGISRFRSRLGGHWSPAVVFPEHFDLSTIWFQGADFDQNKAHIAVGFAPFSPGFPRPYWYAYAYPYPDEPTYPNLPKPAYWNFEPWRGVVVDYDAIAAQEDPSVFIERISLDVFHILRGMLE